MVFEIHESAGELGSIFTLNAEWYYPLGPKHKSRVKALILDVKNLRRSIAWAKQKNQPLDHNSIVVFKRIIFEADWLEKIIPKSEHGFPHGDFTIIPMKGVSAKNIESCLAALDKASTYIRPKFPQVLYGKVYLGTSVGKGYANITIYVEDHDQVSLSTRASSTVGDVHAICHELGHRFFHKFWKNTEQKDQFRRLSQEPEYEVVEFDKPTRAKLADEFLSNAEKMREGVKSPPVSDLLSDWIKALKARPEIRDIMSLGKKFTWEKDDSVRDKLWAALALPSEPTVQVRTDKILREPLNVSEYAKRTNWQENFAEAFAYYVMGKPLPAEIAAILDKAG